MWLAVIPRMHADALESSVDRTSRFWAITPELEAAIELRRRELRTL
jgi:hypothetical protein